jgi:micrococcal nuclease
MKKTMSIYVLLTSLCLIHAQASFGEDSPISQSVTIMLDGEEATVNFNDGDTFKVLDGKYARSRVRVGGMNALESYGPVHEWSGNSGEYLLDMAHKATQMARDGQWHCVLEDGKDAYGRLLAICDDLSLALIRAGLAHAYSVDNTPADPDYLAAQRIAQATQKGMWKHGVPEFIVTSLHSADEGAKDPYNRLICTEDGHSEKWHHHDNYETCEVVCFSDDSCMTYVPFGQRYGRARPECLLK